MHVSDDPLGGISPIVHVSSKSWSDLSQEARNHLHEQAAQLPLDQPSWLALAPDEE